jgi:hypothetical protein
MDGWIDQREDKGGVWVVFINALLLHKSLTDIVIIHIYTTAVHCALSLLSSHAVGDLLQDALADVTLVHFLTHHVQRLDASHSPCEVNAQASCVAVPRQPQCRNPQQSA